MADDAAAADEQAAAAPAAAAGDGKELPADELIDGHPAELVAVMRKHGLEPKFFHLPPKPRGKMPLSFAYRHCLRMTEKHPAYEEQTKKGKNFQCLVEKADGSFCGDFIKCKPSKVAGFFEMDAAVGHFKGIRKHEGTAAYKRAHAKKAKQAQRAVQKSLVDGGKGGFSFSTCASEEEQKYKQAQWYIYGRHLVSKDTFNDEYFRDMLFAQNKAAKIVAETDLIHFVNAEYDLFCLRQWQKGQRGRRRCCAVTAATAVAALNTLDQGKPQLLGLHWTRVNKSQAWSWIPWTWSQGTLEYPVPWRPPRHTLQPP